MADLLDGGAFDGPSGPKVIRAVSMADAVSIAAGLAEPGDVVLLSPGGTSYDSFVDFAERGEFFRQLVWQLPESYGKRGTEVNDNSNELIN